MLYEIVGEPLPVAICDLEADESIVTESGSMAWMSENIKMDTFTGGGVGGMIGKMMAGEKLFQNRFTAVEKSGQIAFVSKVPGSIRAFEINKNKSIIVQKGGFLVGSEDIQVSVHFKKKLATSIFGGEGFIMQKISGQGTALIEIDGFAVEHNLDEGEKIIVNTGYLAMMEDTCTMDIKMVSGLKNKIFGREGLFLTVITGPGKVVLQTMPMSNLAGAIEPYLNKPMVNNNENSKEKEKDK